MKQSLRQWATAVAALLPGILARMALRALGHAIGPGARIGFSLLLVDRLVLQGGARIGHFNFLRLRRLVMRRGSYFGRANLVHGPLSIALSARAAIGNRNKIVRGPIGFVTNGPALLRLGELSKITADHRVDCTSSFWVGDFSTIAGTGTQIWTHGYLHDEQGPGRYRVDGRVVIGNNVYVGSACILTTGVHIADGIIVGTGTTVARSLTEPGMYVSAGLRHLDRPADPDSRSDLEPVDAPLLCERVYVKRDKH